MLKVGLTLLALLATVAVSQASEDGLCVQQKLQDLGFYSGGIDGALGKKSQAAAADFAAATGRDLAPLSDKTAAEWCVALSAIEKPAGTPPEAIMAADAKGLFVTAYSSVDEKKSVSVQSMAGRTALKMDLKFEWEGGPLDWNRYGKPGEAQRSQYYERETDRMLPDKDYWYTVSVYVPPKMDAVKTYLQLFDIKYAIDDNGTVPGIQFILYPEGMTFETNISGKWVCGTYANAEGGRTPICNRTSAEGIVDSQADMSGRWLDMVAHFRWASEDGVVAIWFDGKPMYATTGDTLKGARHVQFKFGPYRLGMNNTDPGPVTLYYSHVARAGDCPALEIDGCDTVFAEAPADGLQNLTNVRINPFNELDLLSVEGHEVAYFDGAEHRPDVDPVNEVDTRQNFDDFPGQSAQIMAGLASKVYVGKVYLDSPSYMLNYAIKGQYSVAGKKLLKLSIPFDDPLGDKQPADLVACGASTEVWDDQQHHLVIPFRPQEDGSFKVYNPDCILGALPEDVAKRVAFLFDNFADIAIGLINRGGSEALTNDNLRAFMNDVAFGKVTVSR